MAYLIGVFLFLLSHVWAESPCKDCQLPSPKEESELMKVVNTESRRLYHSLDCKGKNKALEFAKHCENKNLAIQEAAKDMALRQREEYPNQKDYQKQIQERSGQYLYNERFGY